MKAKPSNYKVILVGDSNVGKTSLAVAATNGSMPPGHQPTVSAAYYGIDVEVDEQTCTLDIWDTAGQEKYRAIVPQYVRNAVAAVVVFDLTSGQTFENAKNWCKFVREHSESPYIVLFGNKNDLGEERVVDADDVVTWAEGEEITYFEGSAMTGDRVEELMKCLAEACLGMFKDGKEPKSVVKLKGDTRAKKSCC